jgi:hypothetical protein
MKSLWAKSFTPTTWWHSMYYHAPMPHHTQHDWQGRLIVVIGHTFISSEWTLITAHNHIFYHDVDLDPIPWKIQPFGRVIFLLLLQYSRHHTKLTLPKFTFTQVLLASSTTTTSHSYSSNIGSQAALTISFGFSRPDWTFHLFASMTWKKCKLAIVDEYELTIFQKNFPLTQFLFTIYSNPWLSLFLLTFWFPFHALVA